MSHTNNHSFPRRSFLQATALGIAAPSLIPASALGANGRPAPSNRITLGFIGVGMMGQGHVRVCLHQADAQVLAVCDVDKWRRENSQAVVNQEYAAAQPSGAYRGCAAYNDLRELLARSDIDAVLIATGDRWHAAATILAAKAGKDVYCEKPVSLTIREGRAMIDTIRRYGRVFQAGLQQRSSPEFIRATSLVRAGAIGKVQLVYVVFPGASSDVNLTPEPVPEGLDWDLWLGPAPWRPFNGRFHIYGRPPRVVPWDFCRDFGGGNLTSNAVHAFDVVQWALGMDESGPIEIIPPSDVARVSNSSGNVGRVSNSSSASTPPENSAPNSYPELTYKYPDGTLLQTVDWRLDPQKHVVPKGWDVTKRIQAFGALYIGEKGWIHVGRSGYLESFPADILRDTSKQPQPDRAVAGHHSNWFDCIRTRSLPACDVAVGVRSTMVAQLGCIAHWTGRRLHWDPAKEVFINDDEANRWLSRAMRPPWTV